MARTHGHRKQTRSPSPFASEADLKAYGFKAAEIARVLGKARGARAARSGFAYEDTFATCALLRGCGTALKGGKAVSVAEARGAFVDDLVVKETAVFTFHQLKTSARESWSKDGGALEKDFKNQARLCRRRGIQYRLALVVPSAATRSRLEKTLPSGLKRTRVARFPEANRLADLTKIGTTSADLDELLAFGKPGPADRETLLQRIYFAWMDRNDRSVFLRATSLLRTLQGDPLSFVARPYRDTTPGWRRAKRILDAIPNLVVTIDRGYFCYDHLGGVTRGHDIRCGSIAYRNLVRRIVSKKPRTFDALEKLL